MKVYYMVKVSAPPYHEPIWEWRTVMGAKYNRYATKKMKLPLQ